MSKPKGGRGHKAPYETKLMRVPEPIASQIENLCQQYRDFVAGGGDPTDPPCFLLERIEVAAAEYPTTDSQSAQPIILSDNPQEPKPPETVPEPTAFKVGDRVLVIGKKSPYCGKCGEITWIDPNRKRGKYSVNLDKERRRKTVNSGCFSASEITLIPREE